MEPGLTNINLVRSTSNELAPEEVGSESKDSLPNKTSSQELGTTTKAQTRQTKTRI
jgi:hypothetical protein